MNPVHSPYIIFIGLWPIAFIVIWAVFASRRENKDARLSEQALNWPQVKGKVVSSEVVMTHATVTYEYEVEGKAYSGTYEVTLTPPLPDRSGVSARAFNKAAQESTSQYPAGSKVLIRYDPKQPEQSVLYCSDEDLPTPDPTGTPTFGSIE